MSDRVKGEAMHDSHQIGDSKGERETVYMRDTVSGSNDLRPAPRERESDRQTTATVFLLVLLDTCLRGKFREIPERAKEFWRGQTSTPRGF